MTGPDQVRAHESGRPQVSAVTIRRDGVATQLPLININRLFGSIEDYNEQFSMGSMMARMVIGVLDNAMRDEGGIRISPLPSERREQRIVAAQVREEYAETLRAMGLSLEPVAGKQAVMISEGEQAGAGELRINVADHVQFTQFLEAVTPQHMEAAPLAMHLTTVAKSLEQQVLDNYDLHDPSREALELFHGMGAILEHYRRLGIPVQRLETYYEHAQKKDLREFLLVERFGLLWQPGQYFGPADWQKDANTKQLHDRWAQALQALTVMATNPNAAELRGQVLAHLKHCADLASRDLPTLASYNDEEKAAMGQVLATVQEVLATYTQ